jgi:DNA-binding phage protein
MASKSKRHKVAPYDSAGYLKTEADIKNYLEAVFEAPSGSADADSHARRCCSSARHDEDLKGHRHHPRRPYKALSPNGNPSFETVTKIVGAFGMRLSA